MKSSLKKTAQASKWYDVKNKADFNDEIKTKTKLLKAKIAKLEKEIKGLEKQKETETDKRKKLFLLSVSPHFIYWSVLYFYWLNRS